MKTENVLCFVVFGLLIIHVIELWRHPHKKEVEISNRVIMDNGQDEPFVFLPCPEGIEGCIVLHMGELTTEEKEAFGFGTTATTSGTLLIGGHPNESQFDYCPSCGSMFFGKGEIPEHECKPPQYIPW